MRTQQWSVRKRQIEFYVIKSRRFDGSEKYFSEIYIYIYIYNISTSCSAHFLNRKTDHFRFHWHTVTLCSKKYHVLQKTQLMIMGMMTMTRKCQEYDSISSTSRNWIMVRIFVSKGEINNNISNVQTTIDIGGSMSRMLNRKTIRSDSIMSEYWHDFNLFILKIWYSKTLTSHMKSSLFMLRVSVNRTFKTSKMSPRE